jgi:hypothetical protein
MIGASPSTSDLSTVNQVFFPQCQPPKHSERCRVMCIGTKLSTGCKMPTTAIGGGACGVAIFLAAETALKRWKVATATGANPRIL